jgi:hypothetical protein
MSDNVNTNPTIEAVVKETLNSLLSEISIEVLKENQELINKITTAYAAYTDVDNKLRYHIGISFMEFPELLEKLGRKCSGCYVTVTQNGENAMSFAIRTNNNRKFALDIYSSGREKKFDTIKLTYQDKAYFYKCQGLWNLDIKMERAELLNGQATMSNVGLTPWIKV